MIIKIKKPSEETLIALMVVYCIVVWIVSPLIIKVITNDDDIFYIKNHYYCNIPENLCINSLKKFNYTICNEDIKYCETNQDCYSLSYMILLVIFLPILLLIIIFPIIKCEN